MLTAIHLYSIRTIFDQYRRRWPTLYKCYTNVLCRVRPTDKAQSQTEKNCWLYRHDRKMYQFKNPVHVICDIERESTSNVTNLISNGLFILRCMPSNEWFHFRNHSNSVFEVLYPSNVIIGQFQTSAINQKPTKYRKLYENTGTWWDK